MRSRALVLIVDDVPTNVALVDAALKDDYDVFSASSGEEAIQLALATLPDLILLDVLMPGIDGYEVCRRLKEEQILADIPVIFITALGDQEAEVHGLSLGALDYITKPLKPVIVRAKVRNHIELKRMRDQLAELAVTDALTGLSNRHKLEQSLKREVTRLARGGEWLSAIMVDIDFFKQFNDTYGHPAGDRCIAMVAAALNRAAQSVAGLAARYGGEEFACVLSRLQHHEAMMVAGMIHGQVLSLGIPHVKSPTVGFVTVSVGLATAACRPGMAPQLWIEAADRMLYTAKTSGRNKVVGTIFDAATAALSLDAGSEF